MTNLIVIVILVVVFVLALRSSMKHFRGESGCCGGSTYKSRPKKLDHVVGKKTLTVKGMSCQHCVNRVMEAVNSIDGASARVKLSKGTVIVSTDRPISNDILKNAIEKAGYQVTEIKD